MPSSAPEVQLLLQATFTWRTKEVHLSAQIILFLYNEYYFLASLDKESREKGHSKDNSVYENRLLRKTEKWFEKCQLNRHC